MKKLRIATVSILIAGLLAACGGGGGSGSDAPPPAGTLTITRDNAEAVSAEVINSVDDVEGLSDSTALITGVSITTNSDGFNYRDFVLAQLDKFSIVRQQQLSSGVVGVVIPASTEPCSGGGTVTVSGNVADPSLNTITSGDRLLAVFTNCSELGILISGRLNLTINAISAFFDGTPPFDIDIGIILTGLSVTDAGINFSSDGDMRLSLSEDAIGNYAATFSGNSLKINESGQSVTLFSYNYAMAGNDALGDYSFDIAGTINSTILGSSVEFISIVPFAGNDFIGTGEPTQGQLLMTSKFDGSQARLTTQIDGVNVMIDVNTDADGVFEDTVMTTWATLHSL